MLKRKMLICDDCFHYLAKKSATVACFWSYLCTLYANRMKGKKPALQFDSRFTILEEEGFILTTETGHETLGIRILGCSLDSQTVCINKHLNDINV